MAINFPTSPVLNQTYTYSGRTWKWNGYAWGFQDANIFSIFTSSNTAPLNPNPGDRWLKTDEGIEFTWYVDLDGGQWIDMNNGTGYLGTTVGTPGFIARNSTTQSIVTATDTKVTLGTETYDAAGNFDTSTSRFTAPVTGLYSICGTLRLGGSTITAGHVAIYKNGALYGIGQTFTPSAGVTANPQLTFSEMIQLSSGDYVEMWGSVTATSPTFHFNAATACCRFTGSLIA